MAVKKVKLLVEVDYEYFIGRNKRPATSKDVLKTIREAVSDCMEFTAKRTKVSIIPDRRKQEGGDHAG